MNKKSETEIINASPDDRRAVLLPCEPDQFRDFIAGLLGRPQSINRRIDKRFEVTKSDIENLYHLVDQRISSQNDATLIQFTARIIYDDDSSVLLNSFYDFVAYSEVKPLVSVAVHLGWTFLIKFRNKEHPEKQQIDISFNGSNQIDDDDEIGFIETSVARRFVVSGGGIRFRIFHTDRTWGTDIDALLTGQLLTFVKKDSPLREAVRSRSEQIGFLGGATLFIGTLAASIYFTNLRLDSFFASAKNSALVSPVTLDQVAGYINLLFHTIVFDPTTRYISYVVLFNILAFAASIYGGTKLGNAAQGKVKSFVLLTNQSLENKRLWDLRHDNSPKRLLFSIIGSLVVSVIGNWLFYLILNALPNR